MRQASSARTERTSRSRAVKSRAEPEFFCVGQGRGSHINPRLCWDSDQVWLPPFQTVLRGRRYPPTLQTGQNNGSAAQFLVSIANSVSSRLYWFLWKSHGVVWFSLQWFFIFGGTLLIRIMHKTASCLDRCEYPRAFGSWFGLPLVHYIPGGCKIWRFW